MISSLYLSAGAPSLFTTSNPTIFSSPVTTYAKYVSSRMPSRTTAPTATPTGFFSVVPLSNLSVIWTFVTGVGAYVYRNESRLVGDAHAYVPSSSSQVIGDGVATT